MAKLGKTLLVGGAAAGVFGLGYLTAEAGHNDGGSYEEIISRDVTDAAKACGRVAVDTAFPEGNLTVEMQDGVNPVADRQAAVDAAYNDCIAERVTGTVDSTLDGANPPQVSGSVEVKVEG